MKTGPFKLILLFFISLLAQKSLAQSLNIDSCLKILKVSKDDTNKVILLGNIAWEISYQNLNEGVNYAKQGVDLARKLKCERQYSDIYHVMGAIYADMSEQGKALDFFMEALKYAKKNKQFAMLGFIYNSLGNFYSNQEDHRTAISFYLQSVEAHKKAGAEKLIYTPYNNLGASYLKLKQTDSAIYYMDKCLAYNLKTNDQQRLANCYSTYSEIYMMTKDNKKSLLFATKAAALARNQKDKYTLCRILNQYGKALYLNKEIPQAILTLKESEKLASETGDLIMLKSNSFFLSKIYEETGDPKNGLLYFKKFRSHEDSLINSENIRQIRASEAKYKSEKKQKEIELLAEKQKLSEAKREKEKLYLYFAIAGIFGLGIVLILLYKNNRSKQKTNRELEAFNKEVKHQKELVEGKNKEITDSINYAQRIQQSILTSDAYFEKHTRDFFIFFKPKDIVSGDFYWALNNENKFMVMTADCTGHGVPGAMMSMMGINFLNEIVNEKKIADPAAVLNQLRKEIITALNPAGSKTETKDGMDCSLCSFDFNNMSLTYSNANNRFYIIRNNKTIISQVNKMPVGAGHSSDHLFEDFEIILEKGDLIITFTDGYADQFGGPRGKKFKYKQLEELILANSNLSMTDIKLKLSATLDLWKGSLEQVDDICIIGIKI